MAGEIPPKFEIIARAIAEIAQRHGLRGLHGTIIPGFDDSDWRAPVQFSWVQGRHGDSTHQIRLTANVEVVTEIPWRPVDPTGDQHG